MLNLYGTLRSVLAGVGGLVWRETKRQEETTLGVPNVGKTGLSVAVLGPKPGQRPLIETFSLQLLTAVTQTSEWSVLVNDPPTALSLGHTLSATRRVPRNKWRRNGSVGRPSFPARFLLLP